MNSNNTKTKNQPLIDQALAAAAYASKVDAWCASLPPDMPLPATCLPALYDLALAVVAFRLNDNVRIRLVLLDVMTEAIARVVQAAQAAGLPPMAAAA